MKYSHFIRNQLFNVLQSVIQFDCLWSKRIQCSKLSNRIEYFLAIPTMLFGRHCIPYIIVLSFLILPFHYACYYALSCLITVLFTESLKSIIQRSRPRKQSIADRSLPIRDDVSNPAFPSGDSAQAAVVASCFYLHYHHYSLLFLPLFTMYGRVYFGAHWIGDTIVGVLIGDIVTTAITPFVFSIVESLFGVYLPYKLFH